MIVPKGQAKRSTIPTRINRAPVKPPLVFFSRVAILFPFVLCFAFGDCLPLHVCWAVGSASFQGLDVIDYISWAGPCGFPGTGTWLQFFEFFPCCVAAIDPAGFAVPEDSICIIIGADSKG